MKTVHVFLRSVMLTSAILLTLIMLAGCAAIHPQASSTPPMQCNSHAYLRVPLQDHLRARYERNAPVRMAILPFSAQENLAAYPNTPSSVGERISWSIQRHVLASGAVPIVEIFNRSDWPGKRAELHHGNFQALERAAYAGYDLLLVGMIEDMKGLDRLSASAKLIEVSTGLTLWNGAATSSVQRLNWLGRAQLGLSEPSISDFHFPELLEGLAQCLSQDLLKEEASYW